MIFLRLFFEFFKTGLFSIGGGLATIPFLQDMGEATGWFTNQELTTMIAVSESTPGPMGVNMATYVGYHHGAGPAGGILGAVIATLGLVAPSIIVILIIARFLQKFRHSRTVERRLPGAAPRLHRADRGGRTERSVLRLFRAAQRVLHRHHRRGVEGGCPGCGGIRGHEVVAPEELHPICFILSAAVIGVVFQF